MDREIIFEKVYSKTRKFILKCNLRYTSSIGYVQSAEHGKIFNTISVTNLSAFSNNFLKARVNGLAHGHESKCCFFSPMHAVASTQAILFHNIVKGPVRSE